MHTEDSGQTALTVVYPIHLLRVCVIGAAPLVSTVEFEAHRVRKGDGIRKQDPTNHARHHHDKHRQYFQETGQNFSRFGMSVIRGTKNALDNHLEFCNKTKICIFFPVMAIGHFRVALNLIMKARLSAKLFT